MGVGGGWGAAKPLSGCPDFKEPWIRAFHCTLISYPDDGGMPCRVRPADAPDDRSLYPLETREEWV